MFRGVPSLREQIFEGDKLAARFIANSNNKSIAMSAGINCLNAMRCAERRSRSLRIAARDWRLERWP